MKTLEQALLFVMSVSLASLYPSSAQTCNGLFRCNDSRSFQLCSSTSNETYSCEGETFCSEDCTFPCMATPDCAPRCNVAGFYCTSPNESQQCVDDDPPSGDVIKCPDSLICSMDCDIECSPHDCRIPSTPPVNNTALRCDDNGIFPDVDNARNFYLCSVLSTGQLQATLYTCPKNFTFDADAACVYYGYPGESCGPSEFHCLSSTEFSVCVDGGPPEGRWRCPQDTFCHENNEQPCSEFVPTIAPYVCECEGKFPEPTNCSLYHLCIPKASGGFHQISLTCPVYSYYNLFTKQCSGDPNVCTLNTTPLPTTTPPPTSTSETSALFVCTEAGRFPDHTSCEHYYECTKRWFAPGFSQSRRKCLFWGRFDSIRRMCVSLSSVVCAAP